MKKLLLTLGCLATLFGGLQAADAPVPTVRVPDLSYGWFDMINVVYWEEEGVKPYKLSIPSEYAENEDVYNDKGKAAIKIVENFTTQYDVLGISLTEFQEDELTTNYENSQLVIYIDGFISISAPTYFTITIPAGFVNIVMDDGTMIPSEEIVQGFTANPRQGFTIPEPQVNPSNNSVLTSFEGISIEWTNPKTNYQALIKFFQKDKITVSYNGENLENISVKGEWSSEDVKTGDQDGDILVISLDKEYTTPGTYVVNIPSAIMWISDLDGGGSMDNPAYKFTYTVVAEPQPFKTCVIDPEEGDITELKTITLTYDEGATLTVQPEKSVSLTVDGTAVEDEDGNSLVDVAAKENVLTVTLPEEYTVPGTYVITIPEGIVLYEDEEGYTYYNESQVLTYIIEASATAPGMLGQPTTISPEKSALVESLSSVTMSWGLPLVLNAENKTSAMFINLSTNKEYPATASVSGNNLTLTVSPLEDGAYKLLVPEAIVIAEDKDGALYFNPVVEVVYGVETTPSLPGTSGVDSILNETANGKIFNLKGIEVNSNNLSNGIYIINGKKVIIKK